MIKAFTLLAATIAAVSACDAGENRTCLDLTLWDMMGDGWDESRLWVEFPDGTVESGYPTCDENPVTFRVCPGDTDGQYYMVNHREDGMVPEEYWEVFWTVEVDPCDDDLPSQFYTGGFNTTMVWDYDASDDEWTLTYWDNLWPNEDTCEKCGDAMACGPKPNPKPKDDKKGGKDGDKPDGPPPGPPPFPNITSDIISDLNEPKYGPPAVDLTVTMFAEDGRGWFRSDYYGAGWYIYDSTRSELFYNGQLCISRRGMCELCLGDGSYIFRVTGEWDNFTSWDFCGVQGDYQNELIFHVEKGKCIPDILRTVDEVCDDDITSVVTVDVDVTLTGFPSEMFDGSVDGGVLFRTINNELPELAVADMTFGSSTLDAKAPVVLSDRKLAVYTHHLKFTIEYDPEDFGVDGQYYGGVKELTTRMKDFFGYRMQHGLFLTDLVSEATASGDSNMAAVQSISLDKFVINDIEYSGSAEMLVVSSTVQEEGSHVTTKYSSSSFDTVSMVVFFAALAVGFVAFVGIMSRGMSGYKSVPQESQHGASVHEVMPTESEHPVAQPKKSGFEIGRVEATI